MTRFTLDRKSHSFEKRGGGVPARNNWTMEPSLSTPKKRHSSLSLRGLSFIRRSKLRFLPLTKKHKKTAKITPQQAVTPQEIPCPKVFMNVNGYPTFEESEGAWGYLVKTGDTIFTLDRQLDSRLDSESAGYVIGNDPSCDIKINHQDADKRHAFIHCRPRTKKDMHALAVYIHDQSSHGIWVNFKRIQTQVVELNTTDIIHFMDPKQYEAKVNPCYTFVKPITTTLSVYRFDCLYERIAKIGDGAFGTVWSGQCKATGQKVAIKEIAHSAYNTKQKLRGSLLREISVCMAFPVHPCIIQINRIFEEDEYIYIVMEYGANGDLFDSVKSTTDLQEYEVRIIFDQIAHAIEYLHEQDIVHRDIKLENVIMCDRTKLTAKLCDFGLSTFIKQDIPLKTTCGTIMYAAPELLGCEEGYGAEVDIWSLGVLLFTALAKATPFNQQDEESPEDKEELRAHIVQGQYKFDNPIWASISQEAQDLVRNMMNVDKTQRYTIREVLAHPWLQNIENSHTQKAGLTRSPELVNFLEKRNSSNTSSSTSL